MISLLYFIAAASMLLALVVWAVQRAQRIRQEARLREESALALVRAGKSPIPTDHGNDGETVFAGVATRAPMRAGIEVSDVSEVVDLDALLAGEPPAAAERARERLEEPTNIFTGVDTLPPVVRAPLPTPVAPAAAVRPQPAPVRAAPAAPASPARIAPVSRPLESPVARAANSLPGNGSVANSAHSKAAGPSPGGEVPIRDMALAWFEARGYRSSPASAAVRPIELVLRHKDDPARAYAFVVEPRKVDRDRVMLLSKQARSIGLVRLLIIADAGAAEGAADAKKGVRVMDRPALQSEFDKLDLRIAAKIIAVARKRAAARIAA